MRERGRLNVLIIILFVLTSACGGQGSPGVVPVLTDIPVSPGAQDLIESTQATLLSVETAEPNCLGYDVNPIGGAIADEYEHTNYKQVMTWFCNGAEFDDILVALETELQTETTADEMLHMLADGFSWADIWLVTGLTG
jgi:hypothetical protein